MRSLLPLRDARLTWFLYAGVIGAVTLVYFADLAGHPFDVDDEFYLRDSAAMSEDFSNILSPSRLQGRPLVNLVFWAGGALWGERAAGFHLLVVFFHALASLLLARTARRLGAELEMAFLAGLLFLVNVAHFRAVYWIAAMAYPLDLALGLAAVLCYQRFLEQQRPGWLAGTYLWLLLAALAHPAAASIWAFCLFLAWRGGQDLRAMLKLAPLGAALAAVILGQVYLYPATPPVQATARFSGLLDLGENLLWLWSRLITTAHWLPLALHGFSAWELALGGVALAGFAIALWTQRAPVVEWAMWSLATTLPFLTMSPEFLRDLPQAGGSRFLYLASAGSSVVLAWALERGAAWLAGKDLAWSRALSAAVLLGLLVSSFRALQRAEAFSFYSAGRNLLAFGADEPAIHWLKRAVEGDPEIVPLADAYSRLLIPLLSRGEEVGPLLAQAQARLPEDETIALVAAVTESTRPDAQERGLEKLRLLQAQAQSRDQQKSFDSRVAALYTNIGSGRAQRGDYEGAVRALRQALEYDSTRALTLDRLAHLLFLTGHPQEAEALALRAVSLDPGNAAEMLFFLGDYYKSANAMDKAVAAYQQAIALVRPGDPRFYGEVAQLMASEDPQGAIDVLKEASKNNPYEARIYYYLGNLHYLNQQFEQSVSDYRTALRLNPRHPRAWSNLGMALRATGRLQEAVQAYQQAIQLQPDQPVFYHNLGGIELEQGDWRGAITAFQKALSLGYRNLETYLSLGQIYLEAGQVEAALETYRQALAVQPSSAAQFNLGLAYLRLGRVKEAQAAYAEGVKKFGATEAEKLGAVDELRDLIAQGIQTAEAQRILDAHWKQP